MGHFLIGEGFDMERDDIAYGGYHREWVSGGHPEPRPAFAAAKANPSISAKRKCFIERWGIFLSKKGRRQMERSASGFV